MTVTRRLAHGRTTDAHKDPHATHGPVESPEGRAPGRSGRHRRPNKAQCRPFVPRRKVDLKADTQTIVILLVITQLVISAAASFAPRLRIPAPLILVTAGICVSLVPGVPDFVIDPHLITLGLLPPLLYASAKSIPAMYLRRELTA